MKKVRGIIAIAIIVLSIIPTLSLKEGHYNKTQ